MRRAQVQIGLHFQHVQVHIRLIEAVKQHQAVCSRLVQPLGHVGHVAEKRAQFDGDRDARHRFHGLDDVDVRLLDLGRGPVQLGRNRVNVQFERIRTGLLDILA